MIRDGEQRSMISGSVNRTRAVRAPVDVWLLTGFLGSGKTTLLRRLATRGVPGELAIIVNEFADVGIDQQVVRRADDNLFLLEGGCVCCVVKDRLVDALHQLRVGRGRGEWSGLRCVVIETSGIADPAPVVHALHADPRLSQDFALASVLTVVDATRGVEQIDRFVEASSQIAAADHLLISKPDLARPEDLFQLEEQLARLNPLAERHRMEHGVIQGEADDCGLPLHRLRQATAVVSRSHEPVRHESGISAQLIERGLIDWLPFCDWLQALCLACGRDLLRVKGIVHAKGEARARLVNAVNFAIYPMQTLDGDCATARTTRLVLIGRNLHTRRIMRTLDAALPPGLDGYCGGRGVPTSASSSR